MGGILKTLFQGMTKGLKKIPDKIGTLPSKEQLIEKAILRGIVDMPKRPL